MFKLNIGDYILIVNCNTNSAHWHNVFSVKTTYAVLELVKKHYGGLNMGLIDLIIIILILAWLGGFSFHVAGGLIHLLIVIALVLLIIRLLGIGRNRL